MSNGSPDKLKPALIGGVAAGLASSIPPISCINCICCALFIGGGFLAAYLYLKEAPPTAEAALGEGAIVGALAGVVTAVVSGVLNIIITALFGAKIILWFLELVAEMGAQIPPEVEEAIRESGNAGIASQLLNSLGVGVMAVIFATLGGVLGAALLHKKAAPPAPPTAPPPPPTFES
jgi:hypothetical protein